MSASREKKKRQEQPAAPVTQENTKKGLSKGAKRALTTVAAIVLVAAIVFFSLVSTGFFAAHTTAAVVSGHKITPAMVNYFALASYRNLQNDMGDFFTYLIDTSIPLSEQPYGAEGYDTWADYLLDVTLNNAAEVYAIYDEAVANGHTLSEDAQATIDAELSMVEVYAASYGSADAFLANQYGPGCSLKSYKEYLNVTALADDYAASVAESFTYTQEDLDAYYAENPDNFDALTFRSYSITSSMMDEEDEAAALALCEEKAKEMAEASQGDEQAYIELALENATEDTKSTYEDEDATLCQNYTKNSCSETYRDWLTDSARQEGDTTYIAMDDGTGYHVLYFVRNEDNTYQLPNVRHILVSVTDTTDEAEMLEAKAEAERILEEYAAGDKTAESFAALADQYSADSPEGGLYENITPGYMVDAFNDWCFDSTRAVGDVGIVETEYGYHVMYFDGFGDTYQNVLIRNAKQTEDYTAWMEEATADMGYTTNSFPMRFITKM